MFSVIFDMDGTLLDTQRVFIPAFEYASSLQGITLEDRCLYDVCGMNDAGRREYMKKRYPGIDVIRFDKDIFEYADEHRVVKLKKGAEELLCFLKANNIKLAVASGSTTDDIVSNLSEINVLNYFDALVGGEQVKNGKPSPDIYLLAAEKLGVPPEDCFAFEDSANGIKSATNANMKCLGIADIAPFDKSTKEIMYKELSSLDEAVLILNDFIKNKPTFN